MIQVTLENNQLKVVTNGVADFYSFTDIKSFSPFTEKKFVPNRPPIDSHMVVINFINENKNSPLRLKLSQINNQPTWVDTFSGAGLAVADLSLWSNSAINNQTVSVAEYFVSATSPTYTSGLLEIGKPYTITTYVAADDFTNVGALSNANGVTFIATGDTPTDWSNGSTLTKDVIGFDIQDWNAADDLTTDAVVFNISESWAIQVLDYAIVGVASTLSIQVSVDGVEWAEYKTASTLIDISNTANRVVFDSIMPFKYMRLVYVSNGSTGSFSLVINK